MSDASDVLRQRAREWAHAERDCKRAEEAHVAARGAALMYHDEIGEGEPRDEARARELRSSWSEAAMRAGEAQRLQLEALARLLASARGEMLRPALVVCPGCGNRGDRDHIVACTSAALGRVSIERRSAQREAAWSVIAAVRKQLARRGEVAMRGVSEMVRARWGGDLISW